MKLVLGIETSCDETACAIVGEDGVIHAHLVLSQLSTHQPYGGVVPEMAARAHLKALRPMVEECLKQAHLRPADLSAIAATSGPGLIGGVMIGTTFAKALAFSLEKPFLAINHLEAHALTVRLTMAIPFPFLLLLVSGGHCQLLVVYDVGHYRLLGRTRDDAVGEAFDKTAKLLGLGYPGGPALEKAAQTGDATRFALPKPLCQTPGCDFSFSGLKTAARVLIQKQEMSTQDTADMCASFQKAVAESLAERAEHAIKMTSSEITHFVVSGGVAVNQTIRHYLTEVSTANGLEFIAPPLKLCTDNAAMIAWVGLEKFKLGQIDDLSFAPRPRWPL